MLSMQGHMQLYKGQDSANAELRLQLDKAQDSTDAILGMQQVSRIISLSGSGTQCRTSPEAVPVHSPGCHIHGLVGGIGHTVDCDTHTAACGAAADDLQHKVQCSSVACIMHNSRGRAFKAACRAAGE